jgi:hypothetical protein
MGFEIAFLPFPSLTDRVRCQLLSKPVVRTVRSNRHNVTSDGCNRKVRYATAMRLGTGLWAEAALLLFAFFVVVPVIAAAIGYAAWKGKPKNFSREMYWTAFASAIVASGFLMLFAQRMQADVRTWQYIVQVTCLGVGALLLGVAGGCLVGIFTYCCGVRNQDSPA